MELADEEKKVTLDECVLNILRAEPKLRAREVAAKANDILARDVDRSEINRLFYGKLKNQVIQDKQYRWCIRGGDEAAVKSGQPTAPSATSLSKLCKYYLDCLSRDEGGVSLFRDSKYGTPDYHSLSALPIIEDNYEVLFENEAVRRLVAKVNRDQSRITLSIGYPVRLKHIKSNRSNWEGYKVEPLFIFPVELGDGGHVAPVIRGDDLRINPEALKGVAEFSGGNVLEEIAQLTDELGIEVEGQDSPEFDELALRLQQIRPEWDWREDIRAENINVAPALPEIDEDGFYNRVVIFASERSPYTKGLETELSDLAKLDLAEIAGTALGHWLTGNGLKRDQDETDARLLEVLPLNEEQRMAVRSGLTSPLTVITGPPGTGKSQVVTALLLNAAWKDQKVLFASKNNKAVDVVEARANGLSTRPIVMRLGSNDIQSKLAEYLADLLAMSTTEEDRIRYQEVEALYDQCGERYSEIEKKLSELIKLRNDIDDAEQSIELCRKQFGEHLFQQLKTTDLAALDDSVSSLESAVQMADYDSQPLIQKIFWTLIKKTNFRLANVRVEFSEKYFECFNLNAPDKKITEESMLPWRKVVSEARARYANAVRIQNYFELLESLKSILGIPDLIRDQFEIIKSLSSISEELWETWLKLIPSRLDQQDRRNLQEYTTTLKLIVRANLNNDKVGKEVFKKYYSLLPKISKMFPCWAITSLSVRGKVPFQAGFFDLVVIDEASQCDIASALPLLYRAKRAIVIGDPKQLRHISTISQNQDIQLLRKHGVYENYMGWLYSETSLYDLAQGLCAAEDIINLRDHHRSHADIISYSNKQFYGTSLRVATQYNNLKPLNKNGPAITWVPVAGNVLRPATGGAVNAAECQKIKEFLLRLMRSNYDGSIGVVTPFRAQATRIRDLIYQDNELITYLVRQEFLVDTVHKFQGDERDLMIFSPVISGSVPKGALSFLSRNGNLFNVAITRARSTLVVIGDKATCANCGIDLPPKKWTQRRVGGNMKADSKPRGVQCKGKTEKRSGLTGILRFQQSKWSRRAATKLLRWPEAWGSTQIRFITGRKSLAIRETRPFPAKAI